MKTENVFRNSVLSIIFTFTIGILAFLVNRIFSDQLGQENLGLLRLFSQLIAYISLAELGVSAASIALLFKPLREKDYPKVSRILFTIDYFYIRAGVVILLFGLATSFFLPFLIKEMNFSIYIYWNLFLLSTVITYLYAKYPILFSADQRYGYVQLVRNILKILLQILQIFVLLYLESFVLFITLIIVSNILEGLIYYKFYHKNYSKYFIKTKTKDRELIKKTKQVFVHKLAGVIIFNTDYIVIAKFVGLSTVAIYSSYMMLLQFIQLFINNIVSVITPRIGVFYIENSKSEVLSLWKKMFSINCYVSSIIVSILSLMLSKIVISWMGDAYSIDNIIVILLLINMYIEISRRSIEIIKSVSGYFKDVHLPIIEGSINIILSIILVQYYGVVGVVFGTVVSNIIVVLFMKPYIVFKYVFECDFKVYVLELFKHLLIMFCSLFFVLQYSLSNILILDIIFSSLISFIVVTFLYIIFDINFKSVVISTLTRYKILKKLG